MSDDQVTNKMISGEIFSHPITFPTDNTKSRVNLTYNKVEGKK